MPRTRPILAVTAVDRSVLLNLGHQLGSLLNHDDQPPDADRKLKPNPGPRPLTSRSQTDETGRATRQQTSRAAVTLHGVG
jgi:hypothetical protein